MKRKKRREELAARMLPKTVSEAISCDELLTLVNSEDSSIGADEIRNTLESLRASGKAAMTEGTEGEKWYHPQPQPVQSEDTPPDAANSRNREEELLEALAKLGINTDKDITQETERLRTYGLNQLNKLEKANSLIKAISREAGLATDSGHDENKILEKVRSLRILHTSACRNGLDPSKFEESLRVLKLRSKEEGQREKEADLQDLRNRLGAAQRERDGAKDIITNIRQQAEIDDSVTDLATELGSMKRNKDKLEEEAKKADGKKNIQIFAGLAAAVILFTAGLLVRPHLSFDGSEIAKISGDSAAESAEESGDLTDADEAKAENKEENGGKTLNLNTLNRDSLEKRFKEADWGKYLE